MMVQLLNSSFSDCFFAYTLSVQFLAQDIDTDFQQPGRMGEIVIWRFGGSLDEIAKSLVHGFNGFSW
jgi:hypothetical protein